MTKVKIGFKRLNDDAILPTKAHPTDSGFDLYASADVIIEPGETVIVPTGIAVELPIGYEAQIRPRSGVTAKTKLRVQLGTIDQDYRGEVGVIVDNIELPTYFNEYFGAGLPYISEIIGASVRTLDGGSELLDQRKYTIKKGSYRIREGDRIGQLVVQALPQFEAVEITEFKADSNRGEGGFGSTGVREDE